MDKKEEALKILDRATKLVKNKWIRGAFEIDGHYCAIGALNNASGLDARYGNPFLSNGCLASAFAESYRVEEMKEENVAAHARELRREGQSAERAKERAYEVGTLSLRTQVIHDNDKNGKSSVLQHFKAARKVLQKK